MPKMHVKKNDDVVVITGKHKGKRGKVMTVIPDKGRVVVQGVNMVKRHTKPSARVMQGGIVEQEAPFDASNVLVNCTKCARPRRSAHKLLTDGKKIRVCHACGEAFDK